MMPIRNYPFSVIRPGDIPRSYLPVTVINPDTKKQVRVFALIDTYIVGLGIYLRQILLEKSRL